jgi:hypothetical protein
MYGCSTSGSPVSENGSSIIANSDYIFKGTINDNQEVTLPIQVDNAIVKSVNVLDVIASGKGHENFEGRNVQVVFNPKDKYEIGKSYVFYTKTWLFGETLTVVANSVASDFDVNKIEQEVTKYQQAQQDQKIQERLKEAELVIIGEVEKIGDFNQNQNRRKLSEHIPLWKESTIQIVETLKGTNTSKNIRVLYAASQDVHWYHTPKLVVGQRRIYILNRKQEFQETAGNFVLSAANESYPISQESNIKQLLKN